MAEKEAVPSIGRALIDRAVALRDDKEALYVKIAANRRSLRDLAAQDLLSGDESLWVSEFYPAKTRNVN